MSHREEGRWTRGDSRHDMMTKTTIFCCCFQIFIENNRRRTDKVSKLRDKGTQENTDVTTTEKVKKIPIPSPRSTTFKCFYIQPTIQVI